MESNNVNVYGYIRVSTEGQVKQGYSLAEQRAEIEKYCSSKSYNLIEIFKDEGISGAKANEDEMSIERDGLLDMLASLKENKIQYIVVLSTNRLWRSGLVKVLLHRELKKNNVDIKAIEEERKFLKFVKEDAHFSRYYEGIYILFKTGMRISEFCGLTVSDIDFKEHKINIDHQLQKKSKIGYYIEETKTESGTRVLPMTADVEECFKKIIANRKPPKVEPMVDGYTGFLYFDKDGSITYALHWEHYFKHIVDKYNSIYKVQMPKVTPHVCRHTYCSNMAKSGMNPKTLQYLMGHSDISVTLNVYTHVNFDDAKAEIARLKVM